MKTDDYARKIVDLVEKCVDNERDQCADLVAVSNENLCNALWNTSDLVYEKAGGEHWIRWNDLEVIFNEVAAQIRSRA